MSKGERHIERRFWVWIMLMVNIVFMLLLITIGIIALRVGNYLPENTDILFIVGKNPSVEVGDDTKKSWESGQEVAIFQTSYENGEGVTTVVSEDGSALIAPGTEMSYRFSMYNNGNMAVWYETDIDFVLKIGGAKQTEYYFPLDVRLVSQSGQYLIGDEDEWVSVQNATISKHIGQLGSSSYETFTLELRWLFSGSDDELDTMYGNMSEEEGVSLTLRINTYAEEHLDPTATGGIRVDVDGSQENGGTIRWLWLILLMANTAVLIFYIAWLLHKRETKW